MWHSGEGQTVGTENRSVVCWSFGSGSWGWFQRSVRDFGQWWNCFILWMGWWLYTCMHLSKPTELCHEVFFLIICKFYLGNAWDLCHHCNVLRSLGFTAVHPGSIHLSLCLYVRNTLYRQFISQKTCFTFTFISAFMCFYWFLSLGNSPMRSI